ncbi:MAG TPA: SGNH/GDSL hydrolase family protein [Casimicrobiaceae bacterium]|nr:SGNH/GDSL hydrolase family protein [Casimicrobiaceae bacterium]
MGHNNVIGDDIIMKNNIARLAAAFACGIALAVPIGASAYSQLTVFGDSLADAGNVFIFTGGTFPPSPPYAQRLTNGPTAPEVLGANLGLPLTPSLAGGRDYAYGGAETGTGNFFSVYPLVPPLINQIFSGPPNYPATGTLAQVQGFNGTLAPHSLTVLWTGPNDIFAAIFTGQDPSAVIGPAIGNIAQEIGLLYAAGASTILVPNMANLGLIPFGLASGNSAGLTALTVGFNSLLGQTLTQLESMLPGLDIIGFDTFSFVDAAIANPAKYGFTNVTDPCFDGMNVCANPDQYIFWDTVHPTARSHQLLGNAFFAAVPEPETLALVALAIPAMSFFRRRRIR